MISVAKTTTRNVKRWRDGKIIKRWVAAGMLNAERSFRRVKGAKDMPTLLAALARHVDQLNEEVQRHRTHRVTSTLAVTELQQRSGHPPQPLTPWSRARSTSGTPQGIRDRGSPQTLAPDDGFLVERSDASAARNFYRPSVVRSRRWSSVHA